MLPAISQIKENKNKGIPDGSPSVFSSREITAGSPLGKTASSKFLLSRFRDPNELNETPRSNGSRQKVKQKYGNPSFNVVTMIKDNFLTKEYMTRGRSIGKVLDSHFNYSDLEHIEMRRKGVTHLSEEEKNSRLRMNMKMEKAEQENKQVNQKFFIEKGKMLVNELWGEKMRRDISHASKITLFDQNMSHYVLKSALDGEQNRLNLSKKAEEVVGKEMDPFREMVCQEYFKSFETILQKNQKGRENRQKSPIFQSQEKHTKSFALPLPLLKKEEFLIPKRQKIRLQLQEYCHNNIKKTKKIISGISKIQENE